MTDPQLNNGPKRTPILNDDSEYQGCFVCGARNPAGLHLHFRQEGSLVVTEFIGTEQFQGFPGVLHGGILAALLDETLNRLSLLERRWTMTAKLEIRYRQPAPVGVRLRVEAEATLMHPRLTKARGRVVNAADPTLIYCEAEGSFLPLPAEVKDQTLLDRPELAPFFDLDR